MEKKLRQEISKMFEVHNKTLTPTALNLWVEKVMPYVERGLGVYAALDDACEARHMPSLSEFRTQLMDGVTASRGHAPANIAPLTIAQKRRADHSAIMSMLWLRYNRGHFSLGNLIMERCFGEVFADPEKALAAAAESYPPEVVNKWMDDQKAAGN